MIPLHLWFVELGVDWCKVLIKVHVLTGNDFLSTIGTKLAAVRLNPIQYLSGFGESESTIDVDMKLAERYLVTVWNGVRSSISSRTFDELRVEMHTKSTVVSLDKLPPTSSAIKEHLKRGFAVIRRTLTLLGENRAPFNPAGCGWYIKNERLLPSKGVKEFSSDLLVLCGCNRKCRGRCKCFVAGQVFTRFCHKNDGNKCENKQ